MRTMTAPSASTMVPTASVSFCQPSATLPIPVPAATVEARPSGERPRAAARSATVSEWARAVSTTSSSWRCTERNRGPRTFQCVCLAIRERSIRSTSAPWSASPTVFSVASGSVLLMAYMRASPLGSLGSFSDL